MFWDLWSGNWKYNFNSLNRPTKPLKKIILSFHVTSRVLWVKRLHQRGCIVAQQVKTMLACIDGIPYQSTDWSPSYSIFNPAPCQCSWESSKKWHKYVGPGHSHARPQSSGLLTSAWLSPGHCSHLGSKLVDLRYLCISPLSPSLWNK